MNGFISGIQYERGFGFIKDAEGNDYFFHATDVQNTLLNDLY